MLSFMRRNRGGNSSDTAETDTSEEKLGLVWIRKSSNMEPKLQLINSIISKASGVQVCEAIYGEKFYPPVWKLEEEEDLQLRLEKEAVQCVDMAIELFDDTKGWDLYGNTDGVKILQKRTNKDLPFVLKGEYTCLSAEQAASQPEDLTIDDIFQFLRNTENRGLYDTMFRDGTILRRYSTSVLSYQVFNGIMGLPGREFLINGFDRHLEDGNRIVIAGCTPSEKALPAEVLCKLGIPRKSEGVVRGHCYIVAYDIRKHADGSITVNAVSQPDLGGMIPQMIQKMVVTSHVVTLSKIISWIRDHKAWKNKVIPVPELFIRHNCYLSTKDIEDYYRRALGETPSVKDDAIAALD